MRDTNYTDLEPGDAVWDNTGLAGENRLIVVHIADIPASMFFVPALDATVAEYNDTQSRQFGHESFPHDDPVVGCVFESALNEFVDDWESKGVDEIHSELSLEHEKRERPVIWDFPASRLKHKGDNLFTN